MGKASRRKKERREVAKSGLGNPIARKAVAIASRGAVIDELKKATTEEQIEVLGSVSPSKVGKALMRKAPREMDKGIRNLQKTDKKVTVKELCREIRETPSFLRMSEQAGVTYAWYENLAAERMKSHGIMED